MLIAEPLQQGAAQVRTASAIGGARLSATRVKLASATSLAAALGFAVPYSLPLREQANLSDKIAREAVAVGGSTEREVALLGVLLITLFLLRRIPKILHWERWHWLMGLCAAYAGWAFASLLWSASPALSGKRLLVFAVDALLVYALASRFSGAEVATFGFAGVCITSAMSLGVDVLWTRSFAPLDPEYRFSGIMTPNFQAMHLVVGLLCGLSLAARYPRFLRRSWPLLAGLLVLLFLTRARIGTFLFLAMLPWPAGRILQQSLRPRTRLILRRCVLAGAGLLLTMAFFRPAILTRIFMMGRNDRQNTASLSNRAPLWEQLLRSARTRPVQGFGFGAFWTPTRVSEISLDRGWIVPHAHDTYLDEQLALGSVGACLYAALVFGGTVEAWRRYRGTKDDDALLPALLLTWLAVLGVTESIPLAPNLPTVIAYTALLHESLLQSTTSTAAALPNIPEGVPSFTSVNAAAAARSTA